MAVHVVQQQVREQEGRQDVDGPGALKAIWGLPGDAQWNVRGWAGMVSREARWISTVAARIEEWLRSGR